MRFYLVLVTTQEESSTKNNQIFFELISLPVEARDQMVDVIVTIATRVVTTAPNSKALGIHTSRL